MQQVMCSLLLVGVLASLSGCGQVLHPDSLWQTDSTLNDTADEMRDRVQRDRDPDAIKWLLRHRVRPGMSLGDVKQILGEDGERIFDDARYKNRGTFRQTDRTYKWGPFSDSSTIVLIFRDGKLFNFDPDFEE